jgi:hypothetical protein
MRILTSITFLCLFLSGALSAQVAERDSLSTEDVFILRDFQPKVRESVKLSRNPEPAQGKPVVTPVFVPRQLDKKAEVKFEPELLKPARLKGEPLSKLYRAYALGAIGNRFSTRAEVVVNSLRSKTWDYGVALRHHGSSGEVKNKGYAGFSNNKANLYAHKFFFNSILKANLTANYDNVHRYGFEPALYSPAAQRDTLNRKQMLRFYTNIEPAVSYATYYKDSNALNYSALLRFYNYSGGGGGLENNLVLGAGVSRYIKDYYAQANLRYDFNNYTYNSWRVAQRQIVSSHLAQLAPSVQINKGLFSANLGLRAAVYSDSNTSFFVYPDIKIKYDLVPTILIPYAQLGGSPQRANYRSLTRWNPFAADELQLGIENTRFKGMGGVRGALSSKLSFHASYTIESIENKALFVNLPDAVSGQGVFNRFGVIYDNLQRQTLSGELSYDLPDKLNVLLLAEYYNYDMDQQAAAWHLPEFKITASGVYRLKDLAVVRLDMFVISERYAPSYIASEGTPTGGGIYKKRLAALFDANLMIEYYMSKRWTVFVETHNLANSNFQRWNEYPVQGFTVLGGTSFSFLPKKRR